jgi:hypothetical protein
MALLYQVLIRYALTQGQKFLFKNVQKLRNKNVQMEPCIKDKYIKKSSIS